MGQVFKNKQITVKQFAILTFIIITAQKLFTLPSLLLKTGGRDSWISLIIFLVIEIGALILIMYANKKQPDKSFYNLLNSSVSKPIGKIIVLIMLVCLFVKLLLLISELRVFFNITLSETLTDWLAFIPLCFLLFFIGTKTLRGVGRLSEILIGFILIALIVLLMLALSGAEFNFLKPVLENGIKPVLKNINHYPMWFSDLPLMVICLGQIKESKHFIKTGVIAAFLGGVTVLLFSAVLFAAYSGMPSLLDYGNNISNMLLSSSSSYIYGRFDVPIFCIWIFSVFIEVGLVFYSITRHISYVINYKNNKITSGLLALLTYIIFVFIFKSDFALFNFASSPIRSFAFFNSVAVPLVVFFAALYLHRIHKKQDMRYSLKPINKGRVFLTPAARKKGEQK